MRARTSAAALLAIHLAGPEPAGAGDVTGKIHLPSPPGPEAGASLYGKYAEHDHHSAESAGAALGVIALLGSGDGPAPEAVVPTVDQTGLSFQPPVVAVPAGGQVRFLNSDPVFHNVFSLSPVRKFDLGRYPKGSAKVIAFPEAGVVHYFCDIHPQMNGVVVVVDSPYFTVTDASGAYRIENVPPGSYRVAMWREGLARLTVVGEVQVPPEGAIEFIAGSPEPR